MHRRDPYANRRQTSSRRKPRRWSVMDTDPPREPARCHQSELRHAASRVGSVTAEETLEFACFRVLLRQRQLLANGVPVELGTRAFDLLLALLEADGTLVSKEELMDRAWPGIVVSEENLKVQMCGLRKALGADRDVIRTEFGRGYRLTAVIRQTIASHAPHCPARWHKWSALKSAVPERRS